MAGEHPELDELREAFALDDLDRRIVVRVSRPLHPANQRLADFFGAKVVVIAEAGTAGTPVQELLESRDCIA